MPDWEAGSPATSGTLIHVRLHNILNDIGFYVENELQVGKYSLDCYVRDWHLGFEADGPIHDKAYQIRHDAERDQWLMENAGIPVFRVHYKRLARVKTDQGLLDDIDSFIGEYADSVKERMALAERILGGV